MDDRTKRLVEAVKKTMAYMIDKGLATPTVINTLEQALRTFDQPKAAQPEAREWYAVKMIGTPDESALIASADKDFIKRLEWNEHKLFRVREIMEGE